MKFLRRSIDKLLGSAERQVDSTPSAMPNSGSAEAAINSIPVDALARLDPTEDQYGSALLSRVEDLHTLMAQQNRQRSVLAKAAMLLISASRRSVENCDAGPDALYRSHADLIESLSKLLRESSAEESAARAESNH